MTHKVYCLKLKKEADGLQRPMYPGDLGQKIYDNISNEAWQQWLRQQTILINEYRLNPLDLKSREFLKEQMIQFLFENNDIDLPEQFTPKQ